MDVYIGGSVICVSSTWSEMFEAGEKNSKQNLTNVMIICRISAGS